MLAADGRTMELRASAAQFVDEAFEESLPQPGDLVGQFEVQEVLGAAGVPVGPTLDSRELHEDPHLLERDFIKHVEHPEHGNVRLLGFAPRMSASEVPIQAAPLLGAHTDEVLRAELGFGDDELTQLRARGVIG